MTVDEMLTPIMTELLGLANSLYTWLSQLEWVFDLWAIMTLLLVVYMGVKMISPK